MIPVPRHHNEQQRLKDLAMLRILDTPGEERFDVLTELVSRLCNVPIACICFVSEERQWLKSAVGLDIREVPRDIAFCGYTILHDRIFVVNDASLDSRFISNPMVTQDPGIRFYAGIPIKIPGGENVGTLSVADTVPRELSREQVDVLRMIAMQVMRLLELRIKTFQLEEQSQTIRKQKEQLEKLSEQQKTLFSVISHDLRTPFHNMHSFIEAVENKVLKGKEDLNILVHAFKERFTSSRQLLENLLEWASQSMKEHMFLPLPHKLRALIVEELDLLQPSFKLKGNTVELICAENQEVIADEHMLRFIIRNLVQNANKFTENGKITIQARQEGGFVRLQIIDTGKGMDPEVAGRLFKWQLRFSTKGTRGETGTGLGLLLCKEFMIKHRGFIDAFSTQGEGSTIVCEFPV